MTGGSDGKIMRFSIGTSSNPYQVQAHENSVTSLCFNERFVIMGGNDVHAKL